MKKYLILLVFIGLLSSCDDGDLTIENVDFSEIAAARCAGGNIIYKLKDSEALFFEVEDYDADFLNDETLENAPRQIALDDNNRIFYRAYDGTIADINICGSVQPATPHVIEEWTFSDGHIEIATTAVKIANTTTGFEGGEKISKYRHTVNFKGVTIHKPSGSQAQETFPFGTFDTDPAHALLFNFDDEVDQCSNLIINTNGSEAITLAIDPQLIPNEETAPGTPRTGLISGTTNKLTYYYFSGQVLPAYFCETPAPATPTVEEQWNGVDGVAAISGIVEVTTTSNAPGVYIHEIHLKKATLKKGNTSFLLADDYLFGNLTTN